MAYPRKLKFYIELQVWKPKDNNNLRSIYFFFFVKIQFWVTAENMQFYQFGIITC